MDNKKHEIGIIGLGVMGRNFAFNIADHGYSVIGLDKDADKVSKLTDQAGDKNVSGTDTPEAFVAGLQKPRAAMMLVPAGKAVDAVIDELLPLLNDGDLIIDGGNSHFTDTNRRFAKLKNGGVHYLGVGISGGEKGARFGPSIMPGGDEKAYERVRPIFESAAAHVNNEPCVTWLGPGSAGHYVKMVHNGIEYGVMQLLAECYDLLKQGTGYSNPELHQVFKTWNEAELSSFLVEITAEIFAQPDDKSGEDLIDMILDSAKQKGTGKWSSQDAMELQVPTPVIDMAVAMRNMSAYKEERVHAAGVLDGPSISFDGDKKSFEELLRNALYFGMLATYAQGMALLQAASKTYDYNLDLEEVAKIWRGGCIIRADLLEPIRSAYQNNRNLPNLMVDPHFSKELMQRQADLRAVVQQATKWGISAPALMTSLAYFDGYRSNYLPANLIQAQRDYFGSHTYERVDAEGTFHTQWNNQEKG